MVALPETIQKGLSILKMGVHRATQAHNQKG